MGKKGKGPGNQAVGEVWSTKKTKQRPALKVTNCRLGANVVGWVERPGGNWRCCQPLVVELGAIDQTLSSWTHWRELVTFSIICTLVKFPWCLFVGLTSNSVGLKNNMLRKASEYVKYKASSKLSLCVVVSTTLPMTS